jgi:hypothetical protein
MRRYAKDAGESWVKWGEPLIVYRFPWRDALGFWSFCVAVGVILGAVVGHLAS